MIAGRVNAKSEATLPLTVFGVDNVQADIVAIIDTGFDDFLMLPSDLVTQPALKFDSSIEMTLADGSEVETSFYVAKVHWDGYLREVFVIESGSTPLIGMAMLYGYDLAVQIVVGRCRDHHEPANSLNENQGFPARRRIPPALPHRRNRRRRRCRADLCQVGRAELAASRRA